MKLDAVNVDVIHAGKSQTEREESIKKFRIGILFSMFLWTVAVDF